MYERSTFFHETVVVPTVDEYFARVLDRRLAMLSAMVLNHMADYWIVDTFPHAGRKQREEEMRKLFAGLGARFDLIRDVANAAKHCELHGLNSSIKHASQVAVQHGTFNNIGFNEGIIGGYVGIEIWQSNGSRVPFLSVAREVAAHWAVEVAKV